MQSVGLIGLTPTERLCPPICAYSFGLLKQLHWLDVGRGPIDALWLCIALTRSPGDQSVNVDGLAFSVGRMPDLNDQG